MSKYEFTKQLETGNASIDKEHRELIQAVNKLLEACSRGEFSTARFTISSNVSACDAAGNKQNIPNRSNMFAIFVIIGGFCCNGDV